MKFFTRNKFKNQQKDAEPTSAPDFGDPDEELEDAAEEGQTNKKTGGQDVVQKEADQQKKPGRGRPKKTDDRTSPMQSNNVRVYLPQELLDNVTIIKAFHSKLTGESLTISEIFARTLKVGTKTLFPEAYEILYKNK